MKDYNSDNEYNQDNPHGFKAAMQAYEDALDDKPTGYMISLDAVSSGLQIYSILAGCKKSFQLCGGNKQECIDAYAKLYDAVSTLIQQRGEKVHGEFDRKQSKKAFMTAFYGSEAMPKKVFGEGNIHLFFQTLQQELPGAYELMNDLKALWDLVEGHTYSWQLPDGFDCSITTTIKQEFPMTFQGETFGFIKEVPGRPDFYKGLAPNVIHSIDALIMREMIRRCNYSEHVNELFLYLAGVGEMSRKGDIKMVRKLWSLYESTGFLSARILDYLSPDNLNQVDKEIITNLILSMPVNSFELISNHDCFKAHPNYGNDLREQYNNILVDLFNAKGLMNSIIQQITEDKSLTYKGLNTMLASDIHGCNYTLC